MHMLESAFAIQAKNICYYLTFENLVKVHTMVTHLRAKAKCIKSVGTAEATYVTATSSQGVHVKRGTTVLSSTGYLLNAKINNVEELSNYV